MTRLLVVPLLVLLAGEADLERAAELTDGASADWNAGRHAEAVEKLEEADRIYAARADDRAEDRAKVLRMLSWNLSKLGRPDRTLEVWGRLAVLARGQSDLGQEVFNTYVAHLEAAKTKESTDEVLAEIDAIRKRALELGYAKIAAQTLHDAGYHAYHSGAKARAVDFYRAAIAEREKIGDLLGLTWSRVNLANTFLEIGRRGDALALLLAAYRAVHEDGVLEPQAALAVNLRLVLDDLGEVDRATGKWLDEMVDVGLASHRPRVVAVDRIVRARMASASPGIVDALARLLAQPHRPRSKGLATLPDEVKLDLLIRAARIARERRQGRHAVRALEKLESGDGPVSPHLEARRLTELALAEKRDKAFLEKASAAARAWREVGDVAGRGAALGELVEAIRARGLDERGIALLSEHDDFRRQGKPGGLGGSAIGSRDRSGFANLGFHDDLFSIRVLDGAIRFEDLLARAQTTVAIEWKPKSVSVNGLSVTFFGGYVSIRSFAYGGAASSTGMSSSITLDELGEYRPVPGKGRLLILKNGAVRYELP